MGVGTATGKDKAAEAANKAISSPLLETSIEGAKGLVVNITASSDIGLDEIDIASTMITEKADEDANIIWGAVLSDELEDEIRVTVIATGFGDEEQKPAPKRSVSVSSAPLIKTEKRTTSFQPQRTTVEAKTPEPEKSVPDAAVAAPAAAPTKTSSSVDDDDTFFDIMQIFSKE